MPASNPCDLSIAEAGAALRNGGLTSVALTRAHLDRIAARDGAIGAFVHVAGGEALAAAELADRDLAEGRDRGPLHGIPFAVKDIIDVAGWPIRWGSRAQAGRIATETAPAVAALLAAGAVPLGVVGTYEMATVGPDGSALGRPPVNPWSRDHITGGSSSGSAAAVAAGLVRIALGTDTGGSVRSPSAYCGVVGLKPTYDAVSREGVMPHHPLARLCRSACALRRRRCAGLRGADRRRLAGRGHRRAVAGLWPWLGHRRCGASCVAAAS